MGIDEITVSEMERHRSSKIFELPAEALAGRVSVGIGFDEIRQTR